MDVKFEKYEGPLDLLLRLISRSEIDIYDIPITRITNEYLAEIEKLPPDMEQMSEFLVLAATLLEIKSRMLLPRPKNDDEPEEDPREVLARQLIAHQQAQELAERIEEMTPARERLFNTGDKYAIAYLNEKNRPQPVMDLIPISQLEKIFNQILQFRNESYDYARANFGELPKERFTVPEKITLIQKFLHKNGQVSLKNLFLSCFSRQEMIVTFLALLEMIRQGIVQIRQSKLFGDVDLYAA